MDFVITMVRDTALVSIIVSTVLAFGLNRPTWSKPFGGCVALVGGFFAAWASQPWTTLTPVRYLDWFPYVAITFCIVAVIMGLNPTKRWPWILAVVGCILAAWFLVPDFRSLQPRRLYAIGISTATLIVAFAYEELARRIGPRWVIGCLMASGTVAAIVLAQSFGLKFAQIAGMLTAGLTGPLIVAWFSKTCDKTVDQYQYQNTVGLSMTFSVVLSHLMFIGWANSSSNVPAFCYALVPLAPLGLWFAVLKGSRQFKPMVIGMAVVVLLLLLALGPAIIAHPPWEAE